METKHLSYLKVENFKKFDSLEVNDIGTFNLIVGDNNVGKTTMLEALLFDDASVNQLMRNFLNTLAIRKLDLRNHKNVNYFDLFTNKNNRKILYEFKYHSSQTNRLSLRVKHRSEISTEEAHKLGAYILLNDRSQYLLEFLLNGEKQLKFIDDIYTSQIYYPLISFDTIYDSDLVEFFSKISLDNDKFDDFRNALRYFLPKLNSVEINNAIIPQESTLIIREDENIRPLAVYGDGFKKFFRYLLEIDLCENNRLMMDEIDTGIHYSRMKDFIEKVLTAAKNKNVQIFATTHSKECIEYYTQAIRELGFEDKSRIIKLADTKSGIKAYTSRFEEFNNSLLAESEIR